jgi:hypothetical protein
VIIPQKGRLLLLHFRDPSKGPSAFASFSGKSSADLAATPSEPNQYGMCDDSRLY